MIRPIILALQFWTGDRGAMIRNAKRIADNEPKFRDDVEFCFVTRRGVEHDGAAIEHVSKKFKVTQFTSNRFGVGWPHACNETWCELMQESFRRVRSGQWANAKGIFTFEPDCVPVHPLWLDKLHEEWTATEQSGKWMTGAVSPHGHDPEDMHMNGNGLFHPNLFHFIPQITGCPANAAWDVHFRKYFEGHWRPGSWIANLYYGREVSTESFQSLVAGGCVAVHGVKDLSTEQFADSVLRKSPV